MESKENFKRAHCTRMHNPGAEHAWQNAGLQQHDAGNWQQPQLRSVDGRQLILPPSQESSGDIG